MKSHFTFLLFTDKSDLMPKGKVTFFINEVWEFPGYSYLQ